MKITPMRVYMYTAGAKLAEYVVSSAASSQFENALLVKTLCENYTLKNPDEPAMTPETIQAELEAFPWYKKP